MTLVVDPMSASGYSTRPLHDTYLHAGAPSKIGWPHDHSTEDTFDVPPTPPKLPSEEREYRAEYRGDGSAHLVLDTVTTIAKFDTFADAELAAKALNELKGY